MTDLKRSLRLGDGLAMVVGITIGSGIFRTPGIVAARLGRPGLTFVAWVLGGVIALLGALCFSELATRHPRAGGKYVYAREAFGRRAAFVVGWIESVGVNGAAIAAINVVGVASGRWVQNVVTTAKILALGGVVVIALALGTGAGWHAALPGAPHGWGLVAAVAVASQPVMWTYYGYPDLAKIAEEVVDPSRALPRMFLGGIAIAAALYLLLNAAFLQVLPLERIAASKLVAADVADAILGAKGGMVVAALALLVVLASLNGNVFVTPRVLFGLARDRLAPSVLARVNAGGSPWVAMLVVGVVAIALAATGTFELLIGLAIVLILVIDGLAIVALFRLRAREGAAPFSVTWYPIVPLLLLVVYGALLAGTAWAQPQVVGWALLELGVAYAAGRMMGVHRPG